jgi:hypothetical protein
MDLSAIEKLQEELIDLQRPPALEEGVITLEADEGSRQPSEMVAVGYGIEADGSVTIQLRVKAGTNAPLEQAKELAAEAEHQGYKSNLLVLEEASIPTRRAVEKSIVDPRMIDPKRPLHLGVSVSHKEGKPGSLGAFVYVGNRLAILSASHVIARSGSAKRFELVHRPGAGDIAALGPKTAVASLEDFTILTNSTVNTIDAAIAVVDEPDKIKAGHNRIPPDFDRCPIHLWGRSLSQDYDAREVVLGTRVGKFGRTTGYTEGVVTAVALRHLAVANPSVKGLQIAYTNLMEIAWDPADSAHYPFSAPGDSGAVYFTLDPLQAVAIHIVGGKLEDGTRVSYGCHIRPALKHFNCQLSPK